MPFTSRTLALPEILHPSITISIRSILKVLLFSILKISAGKRSFSWIVIVLPTIVKSQIFSLKVDVGIGF